MSLRELSEETVCFVDSDTAMVRGLPSLERVGPVYDDLSANFRILAACALLVDGDTDEYYASLCRSGYARVHLLRRRREQPQLRNPYFACGNSAALFDVLAARNLELARQIGLLSPQTWWPGEEYEEDFCFSFAIQSLVAATPDMSLIEKTLQRLHDLDGAAGKAGLGVALVSRDQNAFDEAFTQLLAQRDAELQEDREQFWPDGKLAYRIKSRLFVEALAILNLAQHRGLRTADDYPYCPRVARLPATQPFPPDPFA